MSAPNVPIPIPGASDFIRQYPDFRPDLALQGQAPPTSPEALRYSMLVAEMYALMAAYGYSPATVVNMNPFVLQPNGVLAKPAPACPEDQDFIAHPITMFEPDHKDLGDNVIVPYAEPPLKLAFDYEREFYEMGGVFFYPGNFEPVGDNLDRVVQRLVKGEGKVRVGDIMAAAKKRQLVWSWAKVEEANREWTRPNGAKHIISLWHRRAVQILMRSGELKEPPSWVAMNPKDFKPALQCPVCKTAAEPGAIACTKCVYVFDVAAAYDHGVIGPENPAIRRMTVEQMVERELDPAVYKPGYKKAQAAAAAGGAPATPVTTVTTVTPVTTVTSAPESSEGASTEAKADDSPAKSDGGGKPRRGNSR